MGLLERIEIFQKRIIFLRGERSNSEFARFLGVGRSAVTSWVNGERLPNAELLVIIAEKCHASVDWLLGLV